MFGTEAVIDKNDPNRQVFLVPEGNYGKLVEQIEKLSKRVKRFGGSIMRPFVVGYRDDEATGGNLLEVVLDVGKVAIEGWTFVAKLDHSQETGTIVRALPNTGIEIPTGYRTAAPDCDHCGHRRQRRDTYVLRHDDGSFKQVGSTCLSDFLGVDAAFLGRLAECYSYAAEAASSGGGSGMHDRRYIILDEFLAHTAAIIRTQGWVSGGYAYKAGVSSTRELAIENMFPTSYQTRHGFVVPVTDADRDFAAAARDWAISLEEKETLSDYESNILVIAKAIVIEHRSLGLAASIVGCHHRNVQKAKPVPQKVQLGDLTPMIALFERAGSRLKYPKIKLSVENVGTIVLSVAGPNSKNHGAINVASEGKYGENTWYGLIARDGEFRPNRRVDQPQGLEAGLRTFAADPAGVASAHGHKTGNCCFCSKRLKDARSLYVGYGATCASNFALPYPTMKEVEEVEVA